MAIKFVKFPFFRKYNIARDKHNRTTHMTSLSNYSLRKHTRNILPAKLDMKLFQTYQRDKEISHWK